MAARRGALSITPARRCPRRIKNTYPRCVDSKQKTPEDGRFLAVVDRITVALVKQAGEDLQTLQDRTGLSKTDLVNRAISLYRFIDAQVKDGNDLLVRDQRTKETQLIRLL